MSADAKSTEGTKQNFFPSIADVVTQTDARAEDDSAPGTAGDDDEGPGVESIPSLCMNCHEEVRCCLLRMLEGADDLAGHDEDALDVDPLLQGDRRHVVPLRALWKQQHRDSKCR